MVNKAGLILTSIFLTACIGCNGGASAVGPEGVNGVSMIRSDAPITGSKGAVARTSCQTEDPSHICLALKYVVYKDDSEQPIMTADQVTKTVQGINKLWSQCHLEFQVEELVNPLPKDFGLQFHTANSSDLTEIRKIFADDSSLLVATTGSWNRGGSLGSTGANAWTSMPGEQIYGAVLESPVKNFSNIIAHELGHYLSLDHASDTSNLMSPVIYDSSQTLTQSQCAAARSTVATYWQHMVR